MSRSDADSEMEKDEGVERSGTRTCRNGDSLYLQNSDHPGMVLVTSPLTGTNYLAWSRSVRIALGAKVKLGFIDGRFLKPSKDSADYDQWNRVDCMVTSWLLNSISKEIVEAFLYTTSARNLWMELEERFGKSNGHLLYQLQRDISSITQGNSSIAQYFTKLKRLWDELACLMPVPQCSCKDCTCGAAKKVSETINSTHLVQFLMGLNESFDNIRNQILVMDPLPSVNRAYSMVLRVEKQREVNVAYGENTAAGAMLAKFHNSVKDNFKNFNGGGNKKKDASKKTDRFCTYCNTQGHMRDNCFKLTGYPDWYQQLREKKGKQVAANVVGTPMNDMENKLDLQETKGDSLAVLIQQEIAKYLGSDGGSKYVNMTHVMGSAGIHSTCALNITDSMGIGIG